MVHKNKIVSFFCFTCSKFVCVSCFLEEGEHQNHKIKENEDAKEEIQKIVKEKIQSHLQQKKDLKQSLDIINEETKFLEIQYLKCLEIQKEKTDDIINVINYIDTLEKETELSLEFCWNFLMKETDPIDPKKRLKSKNEVYQKKFESLNNELKNNFIIQLISKVDDILYVTSMDKNTFFIGSNQYVHILNISNGKISSKKSRTDFEIYCWCFFNDNFGVVFTKNKKFITLYDKGFNIINLHKFEIDILKIEKYHNNECMVLLENRNVYFYSLPNFETLKQIMPIDIIGEDILLMNDGKSFLSKVDNCVVKFSDQCKKVIMFKDLYDPDIFIENKDGMIVISNSKKLNYYDKDGSLLKSIDTFESNLLLDLQNGNILTLCDSHIKIWSINGELLNSIIIDENPDIENIFELDNNDLIVFLTNGDIFTISYF